jgi:hypothetical protein
VLLPIPKELYGVEPGRLGQRIHEAGDVHGKNRLCV